MAKEAGLFDFDQVAAAIADKMIRRHPHVFGDAEVDERPGAEPRLGGGQGDGARGQGRRRGWRHRLLDDVPLALPALVRAAKLQRRAARVGFDWPEPAQVLDKIEEEIAELRAELERARAPERLADEIGDLLFAVVNLARHLEVDAEAALRRPTPSSSAASARSRTRLRARGRRLEDASLDEMEALWQQAKAEERL